jgi:probable phosphoglycerate mutase
MTKGIVAVACVRHKRRATAGGEWPRTPSKPSRYDRGEPLFRLNLHDRMLQYLIRHGESVSNAAGRVQGQQDVDLSDVGVRQAEAVAAWSRGLVASGGVGVLETANRDGFPEAGIQEIWSSPLARARQTAERIAAALGLPLRIEDDLRELHAGIFQGHLWADLEERFPAEVARWRSGDADYAIPGGESRAQLAARGRAVLESLAARPVTAMIVVAHGGILTAALGNLVGRSHPLLAQAVERPFTRLPALANCSVTTVRWPGPRLVAFNETAHLGATNGGAAADAEPQVDAP